MSFPTKLVPTILHVKTDHQHHESRDHYENRFWHNLPTVPKWSEFCVPSLGQYAERIEETPRRETILDVRWVAAHRDGKWFPARAWALILRHSADIHLFEEDELMVDKIAFPVDRRILREDLEGATRIYKNSEGTGWLFAHASVGDHQDHELLTMAALDSVFRPVFRQYETDIFNAPTEKHGSVGKERHKLLYTFYGEVLHGVRAAVRALHLGEHVKDAYPAEGEMYKIISSVYNGKKTEWQADPARATDIPKMTGAFGYIDSALNIPVPETRWDQVARLESQSNV